MEGPDEDHELIGRQFSRWTVVRTVRRGTDGRNVFIVSDGHQQRALRGYQLVRELGEAAKNGLYVSPAPGRRQLAQEGAE